MNAALANPVQRTARGNTRQRGYAILLVLFFVTLMLLATISVAPNILIEGRREREREMIWRGNQYARGVKLYYRKSGKFPTSLDDLTKPKLGSLRFMRQAYKDPMNGKDGAWRLIYVSPTGQLVGSLKPPQTIQMAGAMGAVPGTPAAQLGAQASSQGFGQSNQSLAQGLGQAANQILANGSVNAPGVGANSAASAGNSGQQNQNPAAATTADGQANHSADLGGNAAAVPGAGTDAAGNPAADDAATEALLAADSPVVMGGNIIGVGSKINQRSIKVYDKAKNYKQFEFIWNPAKDPITIGAAAGPQIGTPAGQPGQNTPAGARPASDPNSAPLGSNPPQQSPPETPAPPSQP